MTDPDLLSAKPATATTAARNAAVAAALPFHDRADFERAGRGLIAPPASGQVRAASGHVVWDLDAYRFLDDEAPPSANPSLWRQAQLNRFAGLFEVAEGSSRCGASTCPT